MSQIVIGKHAGKNVHLNVDALLRGRMLIQANSGKGKSWLLRRLAEQLFGKVQVIILDPEGEFATLREKFGYVLVGKGGETPADPRSAALVARKLLELRASAVCDIYEMKPTERHLFVARFLDSMIDAPKNLWHPCVIILDEAHVYCPEKGSGESEASESVISMATRGRKRGFCLLPATQRLGKFRKDAAAEMQTVAIGGTVIDIDRKRAADALGVYGKDVHPFFDRIKLLKRGDFFCLGPAISEERILVTVSGVETTHPEAGSAKHAAEAPPAPEKVRAMLPKLSDLPKAAEEEARSIADLKKQVRELKARIRSGPKPEAQRIAAAAPVIDPKKYVPRSEYLGWQSIAIAEEKKLCAGLGVTMKRFRDTLRKIEDVATHAASKANAAASEASLLASEADHRIEELRDFVGKFPGGEIQGRGSAVHVAEVTGAAAHPRPDLLAQTNSGRGNSRKELRETGTHPRPDSLPESNGDGSLSRSQLAILKTLAEFEAMGQNEMSRAALAALTGVSYTSSAYGNNLGALRSAGYIAYPRGDVAAMTDAGRAIAPQVDPPQTSAELLNRCCSRLSASQEKILRVLAAAYPEAVGKEQLAESVGASFTSSAYGNNLGAMRTARMIEYPEKGSAKASSWLFLE